MGQDGPLGDPGRGEADSVPESAGLLKLMVKPADASVYIDDRLYGSGEEVSELHGFIRLSVGEHTIQIVRPGYQNRTLAVSVTAGEKQHLDVYLEAVTE